MNIMIKRAVGWVSAIVISILTGFYIDGILHFPKFPYYIRIIGLAGIVIAFRLLQLSGKYLRKLGEPDKWGLTTKLVTEGLYSCVRHPHHLGIGLMITFISILIGGFASFIIPCVTIWILIIWFLKFIEEPELFKKFGSEYLKYRNKVPMLLPNPICLIRELLKGI